MEPNNSQKQSLVINLKDYKLKKIINRNGCIREFDDRYEYCIVKDYENLYVDFQCDSIDLGGIFVQLLTVKVKTILVSIDFPKDNFDLSIIIEYLDFYGVKLMGERESYILNASGIMEAIKFKGRAIVLYERGCGIIPVDKDKLEEVTEDFECNKQKNNTYNSKEIATLSLSTKIILDDEVIDYIPEFEIDLTKDLIISNGHIMVASYIGSYSGCIGFFEEKGDDLPVSWIHDMDTTINIDTYVSGNRIIVNVQHNYAIDIEELLKIQ